MTLLTLFCPICGNPLVERDGILYCEQGGMEVTQALRERLEECYIAQKRRPREQRSNHKVGGAYFCPGCGVLTEEIEGAITCPQCGKWVNEFRFSLIEHHWHSPTTAHEFLFRFTAWAASQPDIVAVGLAGSHARGAARPDSDVDLVILSTDPAV